MPKLCQIEIRYQSLEKTLLFYEEVLGFKKSPCEIHEVTLLDVGEQTYGISLVPGEKCMQRPFVQGYFDYNATTPLSAAAADAWSLRG